MNRKGFTLVELVAMLVVLGVLMAVTIPNISGILNQSKNNIIKDDVAKLVDTAKMRISSVEEIKKPKNGQCLVFTLNFLNTNDDFEKGPNGGEYDINNSFVIVKREGQKYEYYVTLLEKTKGKLYGVENIKFADFEKNEASCSGKSCIKIITNTGNNSNLASGATKDQAITNKNISVRCTSTSNIIGFYN